jgi:hypothetical protein
MKNENTFLKALEDIKSIVDSALAGTQGKGPRPKASFPKKEATPNSLPTHLIAMRDEGFFKQPQTYNEAHVGLNSVYPCEPARVRVALIRLQQSKQLRKASKIVNGRKQNAYVW